MKKLKRTTPIPMPSICEEPSKKTIIKWMGKTYKTRDAAIKDRQKYIDKIEQKRRNNKMMAIEYDIMSLIIQNTESYKGINYTKLEQKIHKIILNEEQHRQYFDREIIEFIQSCTLTLLSIGLLEASRGYIFGSEKVPVGAYIPDVVDQHLELYKKVYGVYPV